MIRAEKQDKGDSMIRAVRGIADQILAYEMRRYVEEHRASSGTMKDGRTWYKGDDGHMKGTSSLHKGLTYRHRSAIIKHEDIQIGRSIGAKFKNYDILDLETGEHFQLVEGSRLQDVETFAGKGVKTPYRKAQKYADKYGGKAADWQHTKAKGTVDYYGEPRRAELHFSQCEGIGKVEFFIKEWSE